MASMGLYICCSQLLRQCSAKLSTVADVQPLANLHYYLLLTFAAQTKKLAS